MDDPASSFPVASGLLAVLLLVLANAFFVAAEFALVGARKTRLDEMARSGNRRAGLARRAIQHLDRYISATQLGITLASLGLGWIGEPALARLVQGAFASLPGTLATIATHTVAATVAFVCITMLHIILGELVPKALALLYPEMIGAWVAGPLLGFSWIMAIPIAILNGAANALLRLFHIPIPRERERLHSPEEIRMLVEQSQEGGSLQQQDARLLEGVFEFTEKTAQEVMTPRTQMAALASDLTVEEAADEVVSARRSRYPVYAGSIDDIVGIVHSKDILTAIRSDPQQRISDIMRPPLFVPGTREVEDVLADMKRIKVHMAIVLDEYGGTAGLVTMEDLLEEIVGQIYDEYDRPEPVRPASGAPEVDGALPISDFNEEFEADLDDSEYTTLGGYVFGCIGRLPRVGDRVTARGLAFEVTEMEGRRVRRVRVTKLPPGETPKAEPARRTARRP